MPTLLQFWVSQKNAWCEYCKVWLKDTKDSWAVHERGVKHRENVTRSELLWGPRGTAGGWVSSWGCGVKDHESFCVQRVVWGPRGPGGGWVSFWGPWPLWWPLWWP